MLSSRTPCTLAGPALQRSLVPSTALLRSRGHFPRRPRPQQQVRSFRISLWSSYLDPTFQKEIRRRYRRVEKYKHVEALNRKLSWDCHFPTNQQVGLKGNMCSAWQGHDSRPGGRCVNVDDLKTVKEKREPNSESINDGIDKLYEFIRARSRIFGHGWTSTGVEATAPSNTVTSNATPEFSTQERMASTIYGKPGFKRRFQQQQKKTDEPEPEIDPITNRRISKKPQNPKKAVEIPSETTEGYRSQFHKFDPQTSTNKSESPEILRSLKNRLKGYRNVGIEQNESQDQIQEGLKSYDEKVDYDSRRFYDCEGIAVDYSDPVQNGLKDYDNKISDGKACPVSSNVTSTKTVNHAEDGLEDYDKKAGYRQGRPSVQIKDQPKHLDPVSQAFKEYESRIEEPNIVRSSDTKSDPRDPFEQAVRDYESSYLYKEVQKKKETDHLLKSIQHYEDHFKQLPTKLTGRRPDQEKPNATLEAIQIYGSNTNTSRNGNESQESLDPILKSFREYKADRQATQASPNTQETASSQVRATEDHSSASVGSSVSSSPLPKKCPVQEGLEEYDAKVNNYQKPRSGRRTVKSLAFASTPSERASLKGIPEDTTEDLDLLRTSDVRAASGIIRSPSKETDLEKNAKRRQLEDSFESFQNAKSVIDEAAATKKVHASRKLAEELLIEQSELLNHVAHARGRVNAKIAEVEAGWKPEVSEKKNMTGNFVRDFPEEFEAKWTNSEAGVEGLTSKSKAGQETPTDPLIGLAPESFSRTPGSPRMSTSLDRVNSRQSGSSAVPQQAISSAPEGSIESEKGRTRSKEHHIARKQQRKKERYLVREVRSAYEDTYGTIDSKHRQVPVPDPTQVETESTAQPTNTGQTIDPFVNTPEPTLYKILAYDPTMQSVSTAETTSIVPESSDFLTPAEVLLRLSNPSKFFPHFQSLQTQGYEIVAGSGDVLVFRKVRSGAPILPKADTPAEIHEKAVSKERKRVTNPIDGMQSSPITGDFASPTGFVNYDRHQGNGVPFKSNIDVRREEPVFSGRRSWEDDGSEEEKPKRGGKGKRLLVGAAWVAGCSYAVGVVSEFFRTGGVDGKGTRNFGEQAMS